MSALSALVLDFDGVILLSNEAKDRAFDHIFRRFPKHYDEIWSFHQKHNTIDRFQKFRRFVLEVLKDPRGQDLADELLSEFTQYAREELSKCALGEGAESFLEAMQKRYPLFLASATPRSELDWVLSRFNLTRFFVRVYGSDRKKAEVLQEIARDLNTQPKKLLMIGDSPEDLASAMQAGSQFIGCRGRVDFRDYDGVVFDNLGQIKKYLEGKE